MEYDNNDNIWILIELVINPDDIWRWLSKIFDVWVEQYLAILNDILQCDDNIT